MPWTYSQSTGCLLTPEGIFKAYGFSGNHNGINNADAQALHNTGPLPQGSYTMSSYIDKHPTLGLCVIGLTPDPANTMFGRSGFFIHGSRTLLTSGLNAFLESSDGCIVIGDCALRKSLWASADHVLQITS
jgi:hypothetical protein